MDQVARILHLFELTRMRRVFLTLVEGLLLLVRLPLLCCCFSVCLAVSLCVSLLYSSSVVLSFYYIKRLFEYSILVSPGLPSRGSREQIRSRGLWQTPYPTHREMAAMMGDTPAEIKTLTEYDTAVSSSSKSCVFFWAAWHEPSKPGGQMDEVRCSPDQT